MSFNISFKEGESYKFGLQIVGIEDIERVTVSFVTAHSVLFKRFTTTNDSITDEGSGLYIIAFADQDSIKKHGTGKWQIEIESTSLGVRKSSVYRYEVMQSVVNRTTETPVVATAINQTFTWDFEAMESFVDSTDEFLYVSADALASKEAATASATAAAISATNAAASAASAQAIALGNSTGFPSLRPTLFLDFANSRDVSRVITFTRASVATYFDANGIMRTAPSGVPRINFNPVTGECLGLLVEESRTNLLLNTATLSTQNVTVTAVAHTLSFYGTGTVTLSGVSTAGPLVGTGANNRVTLTFTPTNGTLTLTVSGSVTLAQLEPGNSPTSYIPTTSSTVTRAVDALTISGLNFSRFYNPNQGTFFVEVQTSSSTSNQGVFSVNSGTNQNRMDLRLFNGNVNINVAGASQLTPSSIQTIIDVFSKYAFAYVSGETKLVRNGGTINKANTSLIPSVNLLQIGNLDGWVGNSLIGHIKRLYYFPYVVTDAQLQALTSY